jgi:hypothetical protein
MADVMVRPFAALHGGLKSEEQTHHERFWCRLQEFGAHADHEIARLWSRVQVEETRLDQEVQFLWRRLEEFGATEDGEIVSLWHRITRKK